MASAFHENGAVVLDCGSGSLRAGFAGEDRPSLVLDSLVGRPRMQNRLLPSQLGASSFVGRQLRDLRGLLDVRSPVECGVVVRWGDAERLWSHALVEGLRAAPDECRVLLTETPLNPRANRVRSVELLLEALGARGAFLASQPVLGLYASGRTSGLVLDCGHGVTHWAPVVEGYTLPHGIARMGYAGADLDEHLAALMARSGFLFATDSDRRIVKEIKEKLCYVTLDPEAESKRTLFEPGESFSLPDGSSVVLGQERFRCPEALFDPALMELGSVGVAAAGALSVAKCNRRVVQQQMWTNVVVTGGTTLLRGFAERLQKELQLQKADGCDVRVVAPPNRKQAAWIGGAIVASMATFEPLWISREEYEEHGANIILKKCF